MIEKPFFIETIAPEIVGAGPGSTTLTLNVVAATSWGAQLSTTRTVIG